jgi:2-oxoglutarate ferredoxin oxidoreductase subunit alpha
MASAFLKVRGTHEENGQQPVTKALVGFDAAIRAICGDSGDGMQLAGTQLTNTSALAGNDIATFPDFPAEIRAPRGTKAGVSGFQIHFASRRIFTPAIRSTPAP